MTKSEFFCCCNSEGCGACEWIETIKNGDEVKERVNELTREGEMRYPWKMDIYVYTKFSGMKMGEKRFHEKKNWFNEKYDDLFCFNCEKRLNPIPFTEVSKQQRINIFKMNSQDRITFAENYKMAKIIERGN